MIGFERYVREIDFIQKWVSFLSSIVFDCLQRDLLMDFLFFRVSVGVTSGKKWFNCWIFIPVFPGGFLPTLTLLIQSLESGSQGRLTIDSVSNIGPHYARTLREWRRRFVTKFSEVIEPALREEHPEVMDGERGRREVEIFRRKWLCTYSFWIFLMSREGPLTKFSYTRLLVSKALFLCIDFVFLD